ncbi:hypothetical protein QZH41_013857, partial [Actinostola sp. cb2023]
ITIVNTATGQEVQKIPKSKTYELSFSPLGTYLSTWEIYTAAKNNPQGSKNLEIWEVQSGNLVASFAQKKQETWQPRWTDNEEVCARSVTNEVHCFHDCDFGTIATKLRIQGVGSFEISRGSPPFTVAAYVAGSKAKAPRTASLSLTVVVEAILLEEIRGEVQFHDETESANTVSDLQNGGFSRGAPSYVRLYRHPNFDAPGAVLANKSFFKADSVRMKWNRKGTAVLVLTTTDEDKTGASYYGEQSLHYISTSGDSSMVQLAKRGPIYDVKWSPNSKEFCVVYGCWMEMWSRKDLKMISKPQAADTTYFEWSPDGEHILTATTAPRLREVNGFKIWHYSGSCQYKRDIPVLYQAQWQPFPAGVFPEKPVSYKIVPGVSGIQEQKPKVAYVPPHARGGSGKRPDQIQRDDELPQNLQKGQESISKSAMKNKKKREAKARAKDEEHTTADHEQFSVAPTANVSMSQADPLVDDKKIRNLKKKLRQVEELKQQQRAGKKLEAN